MLCIFIFLRLAASATGSARLRHLLPKVALVRKDAVKLKKEKGLPIGNPLVGVTGFEPAASCSQSKRATGLRYTPLSFI